MPATTPPAWTDKISHPAQVGGIETSVLDNGSGRGVRIAWINTGTGLRYKLVIDRAMDIADAFFNQHSLAWHSPTGITPPQPLSDKGIDWLRTWGGGLLTTCGLTHVGGPEEEAGEEPKGLHGRISNQPAEIESIIQPDPAAGQLSMSITGIIRETRIFGPSLELRRTVSGTLGQASIRIHDEVINRGNQPAPHMLLYHCNFGWPLVDQDSEICWNGTWTPRFENGENHIFREGHPFRLCPPPLDAHSGTGEEVAIIDSPADASGQCACGIYNSRIGIAAVLRFQKQQLPWLANWQHWGRGEYVTGLEPCTHPPIGQANARAQKTLLFIAPGERKQYDLEFEVLNDKDTIASFLNNMKS